MNSDFLSAQTWIMPVGNNAFMISTDELPKKLKHVWYRRIRYTDSRGRDRSARLQIRLQNENYFSGVRLPVAHYKKCKFWNRLGRFGVLARKIASITFARNAATTGREQSLVNRVPSNAAK